MDLPIFTVAQAAGTHEGKYYQRGAVSDLGVLDTTQPIRFHGVCLTGVITAAASEGAEHTVELRLADANGVSVPGPPEFARRKIALDLQASGDFAGAFWIGLDGVALPGPGIYTFSALLDDAPMGAGLAFPVIHYPRKVKVVFRSCLQDTQGKAAGEKFLRGEVQMAVFAQGRTSPAETVVVKQTVGADFASDPLEITVPARFRDLLAVPAFRTAVEAYYRRHAIAGFGGNLDGGVDNVFMSSNVIVTGPEVVIFDLAPEGAGGW